ncbi:hypothetical protein BGX26_011261 [Mortierella sp. AD094]|nr:hypothetical protein BGX26_011261 [Mortierella sp. AD094]
MNGISFTPSYVETVARIIANDNHDLRRRMFDFAASDPIFTPRFDIPLPEHRELALQRLKLIGGGGFISAFDYESHPLRPLFAHEVAGMIDDNMAVKLGTERHRKYLSKVDDMSVIGCFAFTELGFGNNAIEMETTATYIPETHEWEINTPTIRAQKCWIGNAALHANWCLVFAQVVVHGKNEGVHAILVRIRNNDMSLCDGVRIEDMGSKIGLNGVDNGRIFFDHVRVQAENLLNRYSDISPEGVFTSSIPSRRGRFLAVASQLMCGRLALAVICTGVSKVALNIALRYANTRLCVGRTGKSDTPLLLYQIQQRELLPVFAQTVSVTIGLNYCKERWAASSVLQDPDDWEEVVRLCCVIKPLATWNADRVSRTCRERCGGQGLLAVNRVGSFMAVAQSAMTAEGDNTVLMQKVTKELLAMIQSGEMDISYLPDRRDAPSWDITSIDTLYKLFQLREIELSQELGSAIGTKLADGKDMFDVWMGEESDTIQAAAKAHGERICFEQTLKVLQGLEGGARSIVEALLRLWGLSMVETYATWYLTHDLISTKTALSLPQHTRDVVSHAGLKSVDMVGILGVDERVLHAPIAFGSQGLETYNSKDNRGEIIDDDYRRQATNYNQKRLERVRNEPQFVARL